MSAATASQPPASSSIIEIRRGRPEDWPLLCTTFANFYIKNPKSYYGYRVPSHTLVTKLEQFRQAPNWQLLAAVPSNDSNEVMGLLLYRLPQERQPRAIAWLTVKPAYQNMHVATRLLETAGIPKGEIECAFLLPHIAKLAQTKGYTLRFRPYLPDIELWNELTASKEGAV